MPEASSRRALRPCVMRGRYHAASRWRWATVDNVVDSRTAGSSTGSSTLHVEALEAAGLAGVRLAMSQENVEVVRRIDVGAFAGDDGRPDC